MNNKQVEPIQEIETNKAQTRTGNKNSVWRYFLILLILLLIGIVTFFAVLPLIVRFSCEGASMGPGGLGCIVIGGLWAIGVSFIVSIISTIMIFKRKR